jgi:hypothetical protein
MITLKDIMRRDFFEQLWGWRDTPLKQMYRNEDSLKRFIMEGLQDMFRVCDSNSDGGCSYREFMDTLKRIAIEPLFNFMDRGNTG